MNEPDKVRTTGNLLKQARQAYYRLDPDQRAEQQLQLQLQRNFILWAQSVADALALHSDALLLAQLGAEDLNTFLNDDQLGEATRRLIQDVVTTLRAIATQRVDNARWPKEISEAVTLVEKVISAASDMADVPLADQKQHLKDLAAKAENRQAKLTQLQRQIGLTQTEEGAHARVRAMLVAPPPVLDAVASTDEPNHAYTSAESTNATAQSEIPAADPPAQPPPDDGTTETTPPGVSDPGGTYVLSPGSYAEAAPASDAPPAGDHPAAIPPAQLDPAAALAEALKNDIELFDVARADLANRLHYAVATIVAERERARTKALLADLQARNAAAANNFTTNISNFKSIVMRLNSSVIDTANRFNLLDDRIRNADDRIHNAGGTVAGIEKRLTEAEARLNKLKEALPVDNSGLESWQKSGLAARWQQVNFEQDDLRSLIIDTDQYRKKAFNEPELAAAMLLVLQNVDNRIDPQIRDWTDDKHNAGVSLPFDIVDKSPAQVTYAVWRACFPLPSEASTNSAAPQKPLTTGRRDHDTATTTRK